MELLLVTVQLTTVTMELPLIKVQRNTSIMELLLVTVQLTTATMELPLVTVQHTTLQWSSTGYSSTYHCYNGIATDYNSVIISQNSMTTKKPTDQPLTVPCPHKTNKNNNSYISCFSHF